jgi:transposase
MNREELEGLTKPELVELVLRMQRPDKTSRTSSKPPSTDRKAKREGSRPGGAKPGHKGHARSLAETPDIIEDHRPTHCLHCGLAFAQEEAGAVIGEYVALRRADVVACDETGVRIEGCNAYQWVFCARDAVVHTADFTRAGQVVRDTMDGHQPEVWISDRYTAQQGHGLRHQTCLAHLDRKARFVAEHGSDLIGMRLQLWFDRAFSLARNITDLAASTVKNHKRALERDLGVILASATDCPLGRDLLGQIRRARDQILTFCDFAGQVDATNNVSERALRPSVIQRKVTNGYRAKWAADAEAAMRSTVDTARLIGKQPFHTILGAISA